LAGDAYGDIAADFVERKATRSCVYGRGVSLEATLALFVESFTIARTWRDRLAISMPSASGMAAEVSCSARGDGSMW